MSALVEFDALVAPIGETEPCGVNLEDTPLLAAFDAFRVFGQSVPADPPPPWPVVRSEAVAALAKSKDLRLLAYLGAAALRTDGLLQFLDTLSIAARWLEERWADTFPPVEEDAVMRRNAVNCFADMVVVDGIRRAPLVSSREHGRISQRDIEMAEGQVPVATGDEPPDAGRIAAAFGAMPIDDLRALLQAFEQGAAALKAIDARMRSEGGVEAAPTFDPLATQLTKVIKILRTQLAARGAVDGTAGEADGASGGSTGGGVVGAVRTRQDAIRALDAVAAFFRQAEPSSPVPYFLERAKRLVAKDFIEVLADVAPSALSTAREAVGLRDQ